VQCGIDRQVGARSDQQRVAVGRRSRDEIHADDSVRARTVVDDNGVAEALRKRICRRARDGVGATPCRQRQNDAYRLRRIAGRPILLRRCGGIDGRGWDEGNAQKCSHDCSHVVSLEVLMNVGYVWLHMLRVNRGRAIGITAPRCLCQFAPAGRARACSPPDSVEVTGRESRARSVPAWPASPHAARRIRIARRRRR